MSERVLGKPDKKGDEGERDASGEKRAVSPPVADANEKPSATTSSKARKYVRL